jgi:TM2 domain-containing membrane protein YozV
MYLRSFPTAIAKTVFNLFTLGFWYFWDLLQILNDGERIKQEGLNTPFDWVRGIGRGSFVDPKDTKTYVSDKSYLFYTFLALCFGWLGADKFYLGEYGQGLVKLISCFNIFVFLFGWFWVMWDAFHAVFQLRTILNEGVPVPMPYSFLFSSAQVREKFVLHDTNAVKETGSWLPDFPSLPSLPDFPSLPAFPSLSLPAFPSLSLPAFLSFCGIPLGEIYTDLIHPILSPPVEAIGHSIEKAKRMAGTSVGVAKQIVTDGKQIVSGATSTLQSATDPAKLQTILMQQANASIPKVPTMPGGLATGLPGGLPGGLPTGLPTGLLTGFQKGGARSEESGLGPVLAGSLAALVLAGGAKGLFDFFVRRV